MFEKFPVPFQKLKRLLVESFVSWPLLPSGSPTNSRHPATKGYVDTQVVASTGLVLLDSKTASNSATIDFTSYIDSIYEEYELHFFDVQIATDQVALQLQVSEDAGANWKSGASDYAYKYSHSNFGNATVTTEQSAGATQLSLTPTGSTSAPGNASNEASVGVVRIFNPAGTLLPKLVTTSLNFRNAAGSFVMCNGAGAYLGTNNAINGLRFKTASGNISSGTFKLYGVKK